SKTYLLSKKHDPKNQSLALKRAMEATIAERFPLGILYNVKRPAFHEQLPQLAQDTLLHRERFTELDSLLASLT
ncbi:MAG: hypothetical protein WBO77_02615, partial [Microgenomates group bacterium]